MELVTVDYKLNEIIRDFYDLYKANICRERQLPDIRDGMRIVQRRLFWTFYELGKDGRNSFSKSAFIIGDVLKLHPHGDSSCYGSLSQEINSNAGLLKGKGNWGGNGFVKLKPAAMRYTECKYSERSDRYFEFIHLSELVAGETEKLEPKFIPVPIPYALISGFFGLVKDVGQTRIPSYKVEDLVSRLQYLIGKGPKKTIKPWYGSNLKMEGEFESILTKGRGKVTIYPSITINEKKGIIEITDISPDIHNGDARLNQISEHERYGKYICDISNMSSKETSVVIQYDKKDGEVTFNDLADFVKNMFTVTVTYNVLVYRDDNDYPVIGIDEWLIDNYNRCKSYRKMSLQGEINVEQAKIDLADAILLCRPLITKTLHQNPSMSQTAFSKLKADSLAVLNNDTALCSKVYACSISRLLTADLDTSGYKKNIKALRALMTDAKICEWLLNWMKEWENNEGDRK